MINPGKIVLAHSAILYRRCAGTVLLLQSSAVANMLRGTAASVSRVLNQPKQQCQHPGLSAVLVMHHLSADGAQSVEDIVEGVPELCRWGA